MDPTQRPLHATPGLSQPTSPVETAPLTLGARVDLPMLVVAVERRESRRGQLTTLTLGSSAGRIATSPFWPEDRSRLDGIAPGVVVRVSAQWGEKRNGRLVVARRPSHAWTIRGQGIAAAVLLLPATGWLIRRSGGRGEALVSIPRPDGHPTWFVHSSAASQIGSRTDRSHCTPRRKIGVDEARDWLQLFEPR